MNRLTLKLACLAAALIAASGTARAAEDWPEGAVTFITSGLPGSAPDLMARVFADRLGRRWNQSVVVENVPGAEGTLAVKAFMGADPGTALMLAPSGPSMVAPALRAELPYDPDVDLMPIAALTVDHVAFAVTPGLGAASLDELIAVARSRPGALNWSSAPGAPNLVFRELLRSSGIEMTHVPYKGVGPEMIADLASGVIQIALVPLAPARGLASEDKIRLIAVTNDARAPSFPDVPTVAEAGYPDLAMEGVLGAFGWRGITSERREQLARDFRAAADDPALRQRLEASGQTVRVTGPEGYATYLSNERRRWATAARTLGIAPATN
ncbi:Bug family tripartite tricarboxylate transporter substrate binding protein [Amaricoccus solimangrovi]|uniref:Tripartite tricarboxylate transporter substrate binding protein n=1 Tax=Amaricoccus solimangrovi TaxID=2589815 RepID=A0A501WF85_9RHOB|nr:tripartite tricarboxylate transporter substrate binding protein [Amaricoccus solimangrovi]TPE48078.1 tripartite tricarboxylate transporter substrate binding protein [Amaricoccus solimangrovi]